MIESIKEPIELRFTIPSITNKLQLMNEISILTDKQKHRQLCNKYNKSLIQNSNSKAIPSQYNYKKDVVNDITANAIRHHTSSHYVMAGGVQFQRGCRIKGVVSRHSRQAAIRNGNK